MDASEICAERLNAKEVITPLSGEKCMFSIADGTVKLSLNPGSHCRFGDHEDIKESLQYFKLCAIRSPWFINEFFYNAYTLFIFITGFCF